MSVDIDKDRPTWTVDEFKAYVIVRIKKCYWDTPSMIVLRSFYVANVQKPAGVTLRMFDFLRGIADDVINDYKAKLSAEKLRLENLHLN